MKVITAAALCAAFALTTQTACAEDFYFSFSGTASTPGTVTGELIGLSANGTSSPTDVLLLSNTDGVRNGDLYAMGWMNYYQEPNTFTVTNGEVTADDFDLFSANTNQFLSLGAPINGADLNLLENFLTDEQTGNTGGVSGVTFTPVGVPEPASFGTFLGGLAIVTVFGRRSFLKKRTKRLLHIAA